MLFYPGTARHTASALRNHHCTTPAFCALSHLARWTRSPGRKERGTALIFALVMLLLLTILGITAITTSSLQEKMAGNMRDQYMAQQAGDSILFDGQALVFNQQTRPVPSCPPDPTAKVWDSACLPADVAAFESLATGPNWWLIASKSWWLATGNFSGVNNTHTSQEPRFVVERIQRVPLNAEIGHKKTVDKYYFRTTGWAVGVSDYSRSLIQGVFSKRSDTYVN
jgi:type IV pilus assembly protein PilX